jgi:hypothetical protein
MIDFGMFGDLLAEYGPIGTLAVVLLAQLATLRQRLDEVVDRSLESERAHNEDFTKLLKSNIETLARLTGYIKALKEAVGRVENKVEDDRDCD